MDEGVNDENMLSKRWLWFGKMATMKDTRLDRGYIAFWRQGQQGLLNEEMMQIKRRGRIAR